MPEVPASGAYVGVWVNPAKGVGSQAELDQLPAFEQQTGSIPAVVSLYTGFSTPVPIDSLRTISDQGEIPLIAWDCRSVAAVASGTYDGIISAYATSLRRFGHPVFIRWFWEMNLHNKVSERCLGTSGAPGYVAAWTRIRRLFWQAGAFNVAFVWCPAVGPGTPPSMQFFPGSQYVDWIGADGYDRHHQGAAALGDLFANWYFEYARYGRPMMIAETGAMDAEQSDFLEAIATDLPRSYPDIKAVVYFDAAGPAGSWVLGAAGERAFGALARNAYFSFRSP